MGGKRVGREDGGGGFRWGEGKPARVTFTAVAVFIAGPISKGSILCCVLHTRPPAVAAKNRFESQIPGAGFPYTRPPTNRPIWHSSLQTPRYTQYIQHIYIYNMIYSNASPFRVARINLHILSDVRRMYWGAYAERQNQTSKFRSRAINAPFNFANITPSVREGGRLWGRVNTILYFPHPCVLFYFFYLANREKLHFHSGQDAISRSDRIPFTGFFLFFYSFLYIHTFTYIYIQI